MNGSAPEITANKETTAASKNGSDPDWGSGPFSFFSAKADGESRDSMVPDRGGNGSKMSRFTFFLFLVGIAYAQEPTPEATGADWAHYGGTQRSLRYSALDTVNRTNVKGLTPAWIFQTGYLENLESTPIVVDGVMYVITPRLRIMALNAATGELIWKYEYGALRPGVGGGEVLLLNRGVTVAQGKVFFGTSDNYLIALDAKTGQEEWRVAVDDARQCGCGITSAPLIAKDKIIIGGTGGEVAHRGYLTAFYVANGKFAWRWYVVPAPGEKGNDTWKGDSWRFGGGAPWLTGSFDAQLNTVYWGTGNASSDFENSARFIEANNDKESNLYTASIVALDVDTGKLRWYRQQVPNDVWDYDSSYECLLVDRQIGGRFRKLLIHVGKTGLIFVLDRETGALVRVFSAAEVRTWISGVTEDGKLLGRREPKLGTTVNVCPSVMGFKSWNSTAYSPRTGFVYIPAVEICNDLTARAQEAKEGQLLLGGGVNGTLPPGRTTYGHVDAWDPFTGRRVWTYPTKYPLGASMLATAGDLVFTGDPEGNFFALDALNGEKLWNFQTGAGNRGSAITYSVNGRQFIATPTGWERTIFGAFMARLFPEVEFRAGSSIVVFALPENVK